MNSLKFVFMLVLALSFDRSSKSIVNADRNKAIPFHDRIAQLQQETESICTSIEKIMIPITRQFQSLIYDAHDICPAYSDMEKDLANIGTQAEKYRSTIEEASYICQQQLKMLTKGLESGAMVIFYLKTGNYTLSSDIVDNWHQSFQNFSARFAVWHIPMDIMLNNKRTFHHEDWAKGIVLFVVRIALTLFGSIVLALFVTFLMAKYNIFKAVDTFFQHPEQQQPPPQRTDDNQLPRTSNVDPLRDSSGTRRRTIRQEADLPPDPNNETRPPRTHSTIFYYISIGFIFFISIAIILRLNPQAISLPKPERYNWYPDATTALEIMKNDLDALQANVSQQTDTLAEIQGYVKIYLDETFQGTVKEFVTNVVGSLKQANSELLDAYAEGAKLDTTMGKAYEAIAAKAKKTGKSEVTNTLLHDLSEAKNKVETLYHHLYTAVQQQVKVVPILKTQTESMRSLLRSRRLIEIGELAEKHIETVIDIDGQIHKVTLVIKDVLDIVGTDGNGVIEKEIKSLQKDAQNEQYKSWFKGGVSFLAGGAGVTATGMGLSMVTVIAAPAIVPVVGAAGVLSSIGLGGYGVIKSISNYFNEGEFKEELKDLEIVLNNFVASMERLETVTENQKKYLESTRYSLSKLANHCSRFHTISGVVIPEELQQGITDELNNLIVEYNRLIATYSLFNNYIPKKARVGRQ